MSADEFPNKWVKEIEAKARFHQHNENDPHGVSTAVYVALSEIVQAFRDAELIEALKAKHATTRNPRGEIGR